jgi:hypothetical protein
LQRQLEQFRSTRPKRTKLPEPLWQAAVELARQHGVHPVVHTAAAEPAFLSAAARLYAPEAAARRISGSPQESAQASIRRTGRVQRGSSGGCVIEFESSGGGKMRIQWKASAWPDWVSLLRAWRDAER